MATSPVTLRPMKPLMGAIETMVLAAYDIFKKDAAALVWVEAVSDLESAERRIGELAQGSHGEYVIFDQKAQKIVGIREGRLAGK